MQNGTASLKFKFKLLIMSQLPISTDEEKSTLKALELLSLTKNEKNTESPTSKPMEQIHLFGAPSKARETELDSSCSSYQIEVSSLNSSFVDEDTFDYIRDILTMNLFPESLTVSHRDVGELVRLASRKEDSQQYISDCIKLLFLKDGIQPYALLESPSSQQYSCNSTNNTVKTFKKSLFGGRNIVH